MTTLFINKLRFSVETVDGVSYGATIAFRKGLNIIYGPNSVGKSSIISGIIYGLGGEKALGIFHADQNPFKPEFYDRIDGAQIKSSYLLLEISNGLKIVTVYRKLVGETNICAVKECAIDDFLSVKKHERLIASGDGVMEVGGLQLYLYNFIGWNPVEVSKYDGGNSKLYLENLLPLFFVEQRAGWTQIQARQVTRYGIREIKKVSFEYLMGLDRFSIHLKELERKDLLDQINRNKKELEEKEVNIFVLSNGTVQDGDLYVLPDRKTRIDIKKLIGQLTDELRVREAQLSQLSSDTDQKDELVENKRDQLRKTTHQKKRSSDKISLLMTEIAGYTNYLERIELNKAKNQQLKKINNLSTEFSLSTCPVCEQRLQDADGNFCTLCHQELKRISSPDENLEFLEDERRSFDKVKAAKLLELRKERNLFTKLSEKEQELIEELDLRFKTYSGRDLDNIRAEVLATDKLSKDLQFYKRVHLRWIALNDLRNSVLRLEQQEMQLRKELSRVKESSADEIILGSVLSFFAKNIQRMHLFKNKESLLSQLKLDEQDNYAPYLQSYDLYNITSSSDNIRIMLSYYLALIQTAVKFKTVDKLTYPSLLLFDEPKQQNLDDRDLKVFIEITNELPASQTQVILTTFSNNTRDRKLFRDFIVYEMQNETDYLLKKV